MTKVCEVESENEWALMDPRLKKSNKTKHIICVDFDKRCDTAFGKRKLGDANKVLLRLK